METIQTPKRQDVTIFYQDSRAVPLTLNIHKEGHIGIPVHHENGMQMGILYLRSDMEIRLKLHYNEDFLRAMDWEEDDIESILFRQKTLP